MDRLFEEAESSIQEPPPAFESEASMQECFNTQQVILLDYIRNINFPEAAKSNILGAVKIIREHQQASAMMPELERLNGTGVKLNNYMLSIKDWSALYVIAQAVLAFGRGPQVIAFASLQAGLAAERLPDPAIRARAPALIRGALGYGRLADTRALASVELGYRRQGDTHARFAYALNPASTMGPHWLRRWTDAGVVQQTGPATVAPETRARAHIGLGLLSTGQEAIDHFSKATELAGTVATKRFARWQHLRLTQPAAVFSDPEIAPQLQNLRNGVTPEPLRALLIGFPEVRDWARQAIESGGAAP